MVYTWFSKVDNDHIIVIRFYTDNLGNQVGMEWEDYYQIRWPDRLYFYQELLHARKQ